MDVLKTQLDRLQKQLAGLTASQKMLTAALVAIMLMTLFWWGKYAGEAEMVPVTSAAVAPDELDRITSELAAKDIKAEVSGDKVLVPADRKLDALSALSYARVLPKQDKAGFETMLEKMNPFMPQTTNDLMFNRGKEITVGQIVSNFPGVADAQVMIDPTEKARIGDTIDPSATVTITMRDGAEAKQQLVNAAADVVEGAQAGLKRDRIKVVVDGTPRHVQDTDNNDFSGSDQLELQQKAEVRLADKVKDQFQYISGLMVSVTVKLNSASSQEDETTYDKKGQVVVVTHDTDETTNTMNGTPPGGEPGVVPNVAPGGGANAPLSVGSGTGGAGSSENTEKQEHSYQPYVPVKDTKTITPAGDTEPVAATVRVPMSYFAAVWQRQNPAASPAAAPLTPTPAQLQPLVDAEMPKISDGVLKCVGLTDPKTVSVEPYTDPIPIAIANAPAQASMSMPLSIITGHAKEIVLAGLACLSLFVVSMMVKKSTPAPVIAAAAAVTGPTGPVTLSSGEMIAGAAGDGGATLDGMELDDDAVRAQQMLEQVSTMVKENPESAATLVKRWLNRS
jgi:flagellar biosynthesis/type III secretory pathway M-ring protein FliF/YscJ